MKKLITIIMLMIFCTTFAYAGNHYHIRTYDTDGNELGNLNFEAYQCSTTDGICENVKPDYKYEEFSEDNYIDYEARGTSEPANYALYLFRDGYIPKKGIITEDWGTGYSENVDLTFRKKDLCTAPIVGFTVVNEVYENEPLQIDLSAKLDAETASAFRFTEYSPRYDPASIRTKYAHLFSATTTVRLEITNSDGNVVKELDDTKDIFADETEFFTFTWTPTVAGEYTIKVTSVVEDDQCISSEETSNQAITTVLPGRPEELYYTLLKNLHYSPAHPSVGNTVVSDIEYLSNYADEDHNLFPVSTQMNFVVREGKNDPNGIILKQETQYLPTTDNNADFDIATFDFGVTSEGWYTLYVKGVSDETEYVGDYMPMTQTAEIYVNADSNERYDYSLYIKDIFTNKPIKDVVGTLNVGGVTDTSDTNGYLIFANLLEGMYGYNLEKDGYVDLSGEFVLNNDNGHDTMYMVPTQCNNNIDDDADGFIDMNDPACTSINDNNEFPWNGGNTECSDNIDNDGDLYIDMDDPQCDNINDDDESPWDPGRTQCSDGIDNDLDGFIDMDDPSCDNPQDNDEFPFDEPHTPQCSDNIDNDGDLYIDMEDPECDSPEDDDESPFNPGKTQCSNLIDDDGDTFIDMEDPRCDNPQDNSEFPFDTSNTQCSDGIDNDGDLYIDMEDPECDSPDDTSESPFNPGRTQCSDGIDNDGDLYIDLLDPDCESVRDNTEDNFDPGRTQCSNNIDDDEDLYIDMDDPECENPQDDNESPFNPGRTECSDGIDNDGDGLIDMRDPGCSSPKDNSELDGIIHPNEEREYEIPYIAVSSFDINSMDYREGDILRDVQTIIKNTGDEDIEDVKIILSIPELGVWDRAGPFDLDRGDSEQVYFDLFMPHSYESGWYYVRLNIAGIGYSRAKWYEVYLE